LGDRPVVGRVERGRCLLDLRCVPPDSDAVLTQAVLSVSPALGQAQGA
jgi:L-seryl-tRNA(Ser) seleniumtransferase